MSKFQTNEHTVLFSNCVDKNAIMNRSQADFAAQPVVQNVTSSSKPRGDLTTRGRSKRDVSNACQLESYSGFLKKTTSSRFRCKRLPPSNA